MIVHLVVFMCLQSGGGTEPKKEGHAKNVSFQISTTQHRVKHAMPTLNYRIDKDGTIYDPEGQSLARTRGLVFRGEKEVVLILRARSDEVTVRTLDKAIDTFLEYLPPTPKIIVILHLAD